MNTRVNQVYKTRNLDQFRTIKGNRPPNPRHVSRLAASIKQNGILQNPILVNEQRQVIDGQHRLLAAKEAESAIYYIVVTGYNLQEVQILNLNQKNWTKADFMNGYADMGIKPYIKLRSFIDRNKEFNITSCIALCQNTSSGSNSGISRKYRTDGRVGNQTQVFEEGTWTGNCFVTAQQYSNRLRTVGQYYDGYTRGTFVSTMISLFRNDQFSFDEFMHKLKLQPNRLDHCTSVTQYKLLIEDIYNYHRSDKVNLRY